MDDVLKELFLRNVFLSLTPNSSETDAFGMATDRSYSPKASVFDKD